MPSPIGHAAAGILFLIFRRKLRKGKELLAHWREGLLFVFLSCLPDIDLYNPYTGKLDLNSPFHHLYTHSFSFAFLAGFFVLLIHWLFKKNWNWKLGIWAALVVISHVLLDLLFSNHGLRLQLFWPFSERVISSPIHFYYRWDQGNVLSSVNLIQFVAEAVVSWGLIYGLLRINSRVGTIR